jgi:peptidoglycan glycosyltransferase
VLKHPEAARQLLRYMKQVPGNTETPLTRLSVAGKTGTAQRGQGRNNDAWYVGVAPPAGYHRLVLCVLIEGGGASSNAAALAYRLFDRLQNENYPKPPGR